MFLPLRYAMLLTLIFVSCNLQEVVKDPWAPPVAPGWKNPHTECGSCHSSNKPQAGSELFGPGIDPSSLCLNCHDYAVNHHPVNFAPDDPSGFPLPLFGGKVRCLTCHEIHGGKDHEGLRRLLRGGPYVDRREICFKCHIREEYATINPHEMVDSEGGFKRVNGKVVCLFCHEKQPDPVLDWTSTVKFRADVAFLCWRCHPPMPGPFFDQHFLVTPTPETLKTMRETEQRLIVIFPLVPRGRITCSTCHNPHQKGVIIHEGPSKGSDAVSKLRMPSICFGCHRM
jgi:predicted CXXCH cytochrome family protein